MSDTVSGSMAIGNFFRSKAAFTKKKSVFNKGEKVDYYHSGPAYALSEIEISFRVKGADGSGDCAIGGMKWTFDSVDGVTTPLKKVQTT